MGLSVEKIKLQYMLFLECSTTLTFDDLRNSKNLQHLFFDQEIKVTVIYEYFINFHKIFAGVLKVIDV